MFSKLFGRASKSADGFQVQLKIPVGWDNKTKFPTQPKPCGPAAENNSAYGASSLIENTIMD
jgi:hypothetical protein